jgi:hypothetical protein
MSLLNLITTILAIAGALGGGTSIAIAVRSRNLITLLKDENAALLGSNTRLEKDLEVKKAELIGVENERNMWRDNVTQAPSIEKLATVTAQQHKEVISSLGAVAAGLTDLTKEMRKERTKK